jgi:hypothetical protein
MIVGFKAQVVTNLSSECKFVRAIAALRRSEAEAPTLLMILGRLYAGGTACDGQRD